MQQRNVLYQWSPTAAQTAKFNQQNHLIAYIPYFEKIKVGLLDHVAVCVCGRASLYPLSSLLGDSVKSPLIVARQRLGRNVTAVTNTHATIEELLDASFSLWPVSYQVGD
jgi:hypothetical protein